MARGRIIASEITRDKRINDLSDDTSRLGFTWLVTFADCEGRTHGDPALVRSMLFPRREDITIEQMESYIGEWAAGGLVSWYEFNGDRWIQFPAFSKHQKGFDKRHEPDSVHPPPPDDPDNVQGGCTDNVQGGGTDGVRTTHVQCTSEVKRSEVKRSEVNTESQSDISEKPIRDIFQEQLDDLKKSKNKPANLRDIYKFCFGGDDEELPDYGYLGKVAAKVGGPERFAQIMWELTPRPPVDPMGYIVSVYGKGGKDATHQSRPGGTGGGTHGTRRPEDFYDHPDHPKHEEWKASQTG